MSDVSKLSRAIDLIDAHGDAPVSLEQFKEFMELVVEAGVSISDIARHYNVDKSIPQRWLEGTHSPRDHVREILTQGIKRLAIARRDQAQPGADFSPAP